MENEKIDKKKRKSKVVPPKTAPTHFSLIGAYSENLEANDAKKKTVSGAPEREKREKGKKEKRKKGKKEKRKKKKREKGKGKRRKRK